MSDRDASSFVTECLELPDDLAMSCAAEVGMAFRAWTDDERISDVDVVSRLVASAPAPWHLRATTFGGSLWLIGAQLSPIGRDMRHEGVLMHFASLR